MNKTDMSRILDELDTDRFRARFLKYTRRAFGLLPAMESPRILDIGCGTGVAAMELLRLGAGKVVGLDNDQKALIALRRKARRGGVSSRIRIVEQSMTAMDFPPESFDIIWGEGVIAINGFRRGLKEWRRFLKPEGCMVLHDDADGAEDKMRWIAASGYAPVAHFFLPDDAWWIDYYGPLEERIRDLRRRHAGSGIDLKDLDAVQQEIDTCRRHPERCRSVFFIIRKSG